VTPVSWSLATGATASAIAVIELRASEAAAMDQALRSLGISATPVGAICLANIAGVDEGLVARWSPTLVHLMPHGGVAVVRAIALLLERVGVADPAPVSALDRYPEAATELEARMLQTVARAASPLAVDLLLAQPSRWQRRSLALAPSPRDRRLMRLVDAPLVVAVGPPNIGKSTLLNALAGRGVAVVADEAGTTRDHLGVMLDLGGLVVRYVDTPGQRATADAIERAAQAVATELWRTADLILLCGDHESPPPAARTSAAAGVGAMTVALRADRGQATWPADIHVSVLRLGDVAQLATRIRDRLVPQADLLDPAPWRFW
jgi:tRNA modification GTPase